MGETKQYRAVIVDDERLARSELRRLLGAHSEIEIVGEAANADEARQVIHREQPEIVFLDIQMPGESGFDLLETLEHQRQCRIIFVTAYDAYAIRAFEVNALDYLMKPVAPERLAASLDRLNAIGHRRKTSSTKAGQPEPLKYGDHLFISTGLRSSFIKIESILAIVAEGDYSRCHLKNGKSALLLKSMKEWQSQLPEAHFLRIHRSTIINLGFIKAIEKTRGAAHQVFINHLDKPFTISRRYAARLRKKFG